MHTPLLILLTLLCYGLCWLCLWGEKKSKKWYPDRALLFSAGFWLALGMVGTGWIASKFF